ncbi:hypothetical protein D3C85_1235400 [compost metagenome]
MLSGKPRQQVHITHGRLERKNRKAELVSKRLGRSMPVEYVSLGDLMRDNQKLVASSRKAPAKPRPAKG